jgi:hypothetical protein
MLQSYKIIILRLFQVFRPGAFLLALACFTFPFLKISCNNQPVYSHARGYELAFGTNKLKEPESNNPPSGKQAQKDISDIAMQPVILGIFVALAFGLCVGILYLLLKPEHHKTADIILTGLSIVLAAFYFFPAANKDLKDTNTVISGAGLAIALGIMLSFIVKLKTGQVLQILMSGVSVALFIYFTIDYREILKLGPPGVQKVYGQVITIQAQFLLGYWLAFAFTFLAFVLSFIPLEFKTTEARRII